MKQKRYETVKQFGEDLKWFEHNCCTIFHGNCEIKKASTRLIEYVKKEVQMIRACGECYELAIKYGASSVTQTCSKPHLLIWAENENCGFWPAKVMSVRKNVFFSRFFGEDSMKILRSFFPFFCPRYLYSEDHPNYKSRGRELYNKAIKVCYHTVFVFYNRIELRKNIQPIYYIQRKPKNTSKIFGRNLVITTTKNIVLTSNQK